MTTGRVCVVDGMVVSACWPELAVPLLDARIAWVVIEGTREVRPAEEDPIDGAAAAA